MFSIMSFWCTAFVQHFAAVITYIFTYVVTVYPMKKAHGLVWFCLLQLCHQFLVCSCYIFTNILWICFSDKYRIVYGLAWITIFVTSYAIRRWFSRATKWQVKFIAVSPQWQKSVFTLTHISFFYSLHVILCPKHINPLKTIVDRSSWHFRQGRSFLSKHCDFTTVDLWRHANAMFWHCDIIFVALARANCTKAIFIGE